MNNYSSEDKRLINLIYKNGKAKVGDFTRERHRIVQMEKEAPVHLTGARLTNLQGRLREDGYIEIVEDWWKVKALFPLHEE